jgi:hypothetical protein
MPDGRTARGAAIIVSVYIAIIVGLTLLTLQATIWNQASPPEQAFYSTLPGVDLSNLSSEQRAAILKRLNTRRCPCECMRTVASCRNRHGSCNLSLAEARAQVAAIISSAGRPPAQAARSSK